MTETGIEKHAEAICHIFATYSDDRSERLLAACQALRDEGYQAGARDMQTCASALADDFWGIDSAAEKIRAINPTTLITTRTHNV